MKIQFYIDSEDVETGFAVIYLFPWGLLDLLKGETTNIDGSCKKIVKALMRAWNGKKIIF